MPELLAPFSRATRTHANKGRSSHHCLPRCLALACARRLREARASRSRAGADAGAAPVTGEAINSRPSPGRTAASAGGPCRRPGTGTVTTKAAFAAAGREAGGAHANRQHAKRKLIASSRPAVDNLSAQERLAEHT